MKRGPLVVLAAAMLLGACAVGRTSYQPYEARTNSFHGKGGTKTNVEGIDFWENGEPPRKFKILGVIDDERPGGIIPMSKLRADVAGKAKEVGADAVIQIGNQSQGTGYISSGSATAYSSGSGATAYGSGSTIAARRNYAKFVVVKYLN